jgi:hypothetical protein
MFIHISLISLYPSYVYTYISYTPLSFICPDTPNTPEIFIYFHIYISYICIYPAVHAAQLVDARGGPREIIWDTDDALLRTAYTKISREDAAEAVVQVRCVLNPTLYTIMCIKPTLYIL